MNASIDAFLDALHAKGTSPNTIRAYKADLLSFMAFTDGDLDQAGEYLTAHLDIWKPATIRRRLASIRSYAKWLGHPGFLADFRTPVPAPGRSHPLPEGIDGVATMLSPPLGTRRYKALIALMGYCGLRSAEALSVRHEDFFIASDGGRRLRITGKGRKERVIFIHDEVWRYVRPLVRTGTTGCIVSMSDRTLRKRVSEIGFRTLGHHVAPHDLRHTAGTAFYYNSDKDLRATQEFLGHSSSAVTERYIGISDTTLAAGADFWKETA